MDRFKLWHRLRGHTITEVMPDFGNIFECSRIRERCTCGGEWTFHALGMAETYTAP